MRLRILSLLTAIGLLVSLAGCSFSHPCFGFEDNGYVVLDEGDTHGGMGNDGTYYLILDCSSSPGKAQELTQDWKDLPLSENLQVLLYGGTIAGRNYSYNLAEEGHIPEITHGKYRFLDRHSQRTDPEDDSEVLNRKSFNLSIALYNADTQLFYYLEFDT